MAEPVRRDEGGLGGASEEARRGEPPVEAAGHTHLGNGSSLVAINGGKAIDTSMAFTPAAGVPMSTRSGDIDPGLIEYLMRVANMTVGEFNRMIHLESGLMGISETSSDMERLLAQESDDSRAAEAVAIYCYHVRKFIGAYAAALGGIDTLIFSGGIGERSAEVRRAICKDLRFLGIELDSHMNKRHEAVISTGRSLAKVRVIATDEEHEIVKSVLAFISHSAGRIGESGQPPY